MSVPRFPGLIIAGGQTGADFGGLLAALELGIPTGGVAPKGWKTERGPKPELGTVFGLIESESGDYHTRTRENVEICSGIVLICQNFESPGSKLTEKYAFHLWKPIFRVQFSPKPAFLDPNLARDFAVWLKKIAPEVLMVAGNRETKAPGIQKFTEETLRSLLVDTD